MSIQNSVSSDSIMADLDSLKPYIITVFFLFVIIYGFRILKDFKRKRRNYGVLEKLLLALVPFSLMLLIYMAT